MVQRAFAWSGSHASPTRPWEDGCGPMRSRPSATTDSAKTACHTRPTPSTTSSCREGVWDRGRRLRGSYAAERDGLGQAGQWVPHGDELVGEKSLEAEVRDGPGDRLVVQLLRV